eukprot:TRINITY_DN14894_c0_g1_i2.p1 TRINITY_DN14894_c0_g1~~TRINITY_DN14894_c0_g1_i2.p1  ORF type:complete len:542 (+),score=133.51 TRINITY_DN14894_c0_g1_i2:47-1627(+)
MFYSTHILTKNGPFAKVWKAAIREKKMTKSEIQLIDLTDTVVHIMKPPVPISCRTHGELMLGCVRIYANKVSFLLRESTEALVFFRKKPARVAGGETNWEINEPSEAAKEKAVTIPIGIEELVAIPELASFDVADMLGTEDKPALGITEAFIPDDWFQPPSFDFKEMSQLQQQGEVILGDMHTPQSKTPAKSSAPGSLETGRNINMEELINIDPLGEGELAKLMGEPVGPEETVFPPAVSPNTTTVPEGSTEPAPAPQRQIRTFDSRTQFPIATIKAMQEGNPSLRDFVPVPNTDEELRIKQDQKLSAADLMLTMGSMRKRKFDFAEGLNTCDIGMDDEVADKDEPHRSIFGQVVGNALIKISKQYSSTREASSTNTGALTALLPSTPRTRDTEVPAVPDLLPPHEEVYGDLQHIDIPQPMDIGSTDVVDPIVSAKETLGDLKKVMKSTEKVTFSSLLSSKSCTRREAAAKFMDLLVLSSKGHIDLQQSSPYTEITLTKAEGFNKGLNNNSSMPLNLSPVTKRSKH